MRDTTTDTVLKWGFWMGVGFAAVQVFQKLTQKPAWEMNPRRSKAETEALKARALELYVPGKRILHLARELGVSRQTLTNWLKKAGVYEPAPMGPPSFGQELRREALNRYVPGEPISELAKELGVSRQALTNWLKESGVYVPAPMGQPITREELRQEALRKYVPEKPISPLARELGVPRTVVMYWLKKAGVYVPAPVGPPPLSKELRQKALRRYVPGEPVSPLARDLGVSHSTVIKWMKEAGVYVPAPMRPRKKR